jgi:hypothetical protein
MSRASSVAAVVVGIAVVAFGAWAALGGLRPVPSASSPPQIPAVDATPQPPERVPLDLDDPPPIPADVSILERTADEPPAPTPPGPSQVVVHGRVTDAAGAPLAGAACRLEWPEDSQSVTSTSSHTVTTRADGTFAFPPLLALTEGQDGRLQVTAKSFVPGFRGFDSNHRFDPALDVALAPGIRVRGRCVDASGLPVSRVTVKSAWRRVGTSAADGTFDVDGVDPSEPFLLLPDALTPVASRVSGADVVDLGDVTLHEGSSIRGTFVDAGGKPVAGAYVEATPDSYASWSRRVRTDAAGTFEVVGLPRGSFVLEGDGHGGRPGTAVLRGVASGGPEVRLVLPGGLRIRFRWLRAADGTPVSPKEIHVEVSSSDARVRVTSRGESSDAGLETEFVYAVDEPGTYAATVSVLGFQDVQVSAIQVTADAEAVVDVLLREKPKPRPGR